MNPSSTTASNHHTKLGEYWHRLTTLEAFLDPVNYESKAVLVQFDFVAAGLSVNARTNGSVA